jgi:uncharacterized membrane protein YcaP (DUF421 family)
MEIVIRALVVYAALWILLRALGKRELGEISAFELLLLVVLGDLVQQGITQEDYSMTGALLAAGTLVLFVATTSYVAFRFPRTRSTLENVPSIVVHDGRFRDDVIAVERLTHDEILDAARQQGIVDLRTVRYGILENDGRFSFLKAEDSSTPRSIDEHRSDR